MGSDIGNPFNEIIPGEYFSWFYVIEENMSYGEMYRISSLAILDLLIFYIIYWSKKKKSYNM